LEAGYKALRNIVAYVESAKYHEWPYVNVKDITNRCEDGAALITFQSELCPLCRLAPADADLICTDCAAAIEYAKNVRQHEAREAVA
jgi:hypothetical protein